ncbi:MAG: hypothetical protein ACHQRJ_20460 [Alphaproteobacteria bacterium]|nr:hypothetical protein [Alphaproteobacteria bacterium]
MSKVESDFREALLKARTQGWHELWRKEDWWAIWLGLGIVVVAYLLFANAFSLK